MPNRDGLATLKELKQSAELKSIPVVRITAFGSSEQTISAMKGGAYDYITKPFDAGEALRTAARAIEVRRLSKELERLRIRPANFREEDEALLIGGILQCARSSSSSGRWPPPMRRS